MRVLVVLMVTIAVTCAGVPALAERSERARPAYVRSVLTDDGPRFSYRARTGGRLAIVGIRNPGHRDRNFREVFRRPGAPVTNRQTTCATWLRQSRPSVQQGLAV